MFKLLLVSLGTSAVVLMMAPFAVLGVIYLGVFSRVFR